MPNNLCQATTPIFGAPPTTDAAILAAQRQARAKSKGDVLVVTAAGEGRYEWAHYRAGISRDSGDSVGLPLTVIARQRWQRIDLCQPGRVDDGTATAAGAMGCQVISLRLA